MYNGGYENGGVDWDYYDKFDEITNKYLPERDEGNTMATQVVTAINKLVYKWYNDGDVYDNQYHLAGWCNDLSCYANWLYKNTNETVRKILDGIKDVRSHADYEVLLQELADVCLDVNYLEELNSIEKVGTIYECDGNFKFVDLYCD